MLAQQRLELQRLVGGRLAGRSAQGAGGARSARSSRPRWRRRTDRHPIRPTAARSWTPGATAPSRNTPPAVRNPSPSPATSAGTSSSPPCGPFGSHCRRRPPPHPGPLTCTILGGTLRRGARGYRSASARPGQSSSGESKVAATAVLLVRSAPFPQGWLRHLVTLRARMTELPEDRFRLFDVVIDAVRAGTPSSTSPTETPCSSARWPARRRRQSHPSARHGGLHRPHGGSRRAQLTDGAPSPLLSRRETGWLARPDARQRGCFRMRLRLGRPRW